MKKIDFLLLKSYVGPFIVTFIIALFVLVMQFLWLHIDDLIGKGLDLLIVAELIFYSCANLVPMALPIAVLLSSIMTFGSLGEHYELVAFKSSGVSLTRIMASLFVFAMMLAVFAFFFSNYILPKANLKYAVLLHSVTTKSPAFNIGEGVFYNGISGYSIKAQKKSEDGAALYDLIIYDHTKNKGNTNVIIAEEAKMKSINNGKYLKFDLKNGEQYEEQQAKPIPRGDDKFEHTRTKFKSFSKVFDMSNFELNQISEDLFKKNYKMLNVKQLSFFIDSFKTEIDKRSKILQKSINRYAKLEPDTIERDTIPMPKQAFNDTVALANDSVAITNDTSSLTDDTLYAKLAPDTTERDTISIPKQAFNDVAPLADDTASLKASTLLDRLPAKRRSTILSNAANNIKSSKSYVNVAKRDVETKQKYSNKYSIEWHRKFTLSFACIVLFFIGAPLGAITRKGGLGLPMILSIIFFVIYHLLTTFGKKLSEEFVFTPFQGAWLATIILTPIGVFLTYKAVNDSNLINLDAYVEKFKKITDKFLKKQKPQTV